MARFAAIVAALVLWAAPLRGQAAVVINELMASNKSTIRDEDGQFADWVELYNTGPGGFNVGGFYMSDVSSEPMKWRIPANIPVTTTIPAGGYLLIWTDGTNVPNPARPLHANFKLSAEDGELIAFYAADGRTTLSATRYGQQAPDISYGRITNNSPTWVPFGRSTPRAANGTGTYTQPPAVLAGKLFVNEWVTSNVTGSEDASGKNEDWLELYNNLTIPIDLGGYYLTDDVTKSIAQKWQIPAGNIIGPRGFALFWCDKDVAEGLTHTKFKLSDASGDVAVFEKDGTTRIDWFTYGHQRADISQGRKPDGSPTIAFFYPGTTLPPSPRAPNIPPRTRVWLWPFYR